MREEDLREEYDFGLKPCCESAIENHRCELEKQIENLVATAMSAIKILESAVGNAESGLEDFRAAIKQALSVLEN